MQELRYNTEQTVKVGVIFHRRGRSTDPLIPAYGIKIGDFISRHAIKSDGTVVDLLGRVWSDIAACMGCYSLTFTVSDCNKLGSLVLYLFNGVETEFPIFTEFTVISQNVWDSKYNSKFLRVENFAQKG